jgi:hypothetical protein
LQLYSTAALAAAGRDDSAPCVRSAISSRSRDLVALVTAQDEKNPTLEPVIAEPPASVGSSSAGSEEDRPERSSSSGPSWDSVKAGGYIGVIIILMSIVALGFGIEHTITIRKQRLMPEAFVDQSEDLISQGDVPAAIQCCEDPRNYSPHQRSVLAGLER